MRSFAALALLAMAGLLAACTDKSPADYQGYVEADFVDVASPIAGRLDTLSVKRGDTVDVGAPLFVLEAASEAAAQRQAQMQLNAAQAQLRDLQQGRRAPEQAVVAEQLAQAQVELQRSATQLARDEAQFGIGGIAQAQLDDARSARAANEARVAQLRSELRVAQLPGRKAQIAAQAAQVGAARAVLEQATWRLDQKALRAPQAASVFDTLYSPGEWVGAGSPVLRLLPPGHLKLRFFVPQAVLGRLSVGQALSIACDGCGGAIAATVSFVSPVAEYTPPIIYSNATRARLVYMIEAHPDAGAAPRLHPGQPVSVSLR